MARNNRHNTAFVVGSVLGAVAGAAVALWKTPYSGEELRTKLGASGGHETTGTQAYTATPAAGTTTTATGERSIKDKVLSSVEKTLAPVVGVELGKTAKGSGATVMDSGEIRVNTGQPGVATASTAGGAAGTDRITGNRAKLDADKWAKAYGTSATSAETQVTRPSTPVAETTTSAETATTMKDAAANPEYGTTLLRHPHAWTDGTEKETASGTGTERITGDRGKVDAGKWAEAYGTAVPESGSGSASKEAESASQTGLGSKPAYPGDELPGHPPVEHEAPDDSIADVSPNAGERAEESDLSVENAASVDDLTTPQVHRVPDSQKDTGEASYHPFPKLGGKER